MKIQLIIILLLTFSRIAIAQDHPFGVRFSHQIESDLAEEKINSGRAGLLYSFIGDYQASTSYSDWHVSWGVDSIDLSSYVTKNALPNIIGAAKNHQIVIVSENHHKPQHRIFAKEIIVELSKIGFEHVGLEAISSLDSTLNTRGYPLLGNPLTGIYPLEPKMGDLVRIAIKSNLNLFGYEEKIKSKVKDRDEVQADNIIAYLKNHPNSKVILVCGFFHAIESNLYKHEKSKSYWLAKILKDSLGIDPLTIYQDNFTEKFIENEHPILKNINIEVPSIFVDQNGKNVLLSEQVDIEVIHPKTTYINGRPSWLYESEQYQPITIEWDRFEIDFPVIVSAHLIGEVNSVPVDRVELKHKYDRKVLVLKTGEYRITIYDGENTHEYFQTVE